MLTQGHGLKKASLVSHHSCQALPAIMSNIYSGRPSSSDYSLITYPQLTQAHHVERHMHK
jgi:hypothetical protein